VVDDDDDDHDSPFMCVLKARMIFLYVGSWVMSDGTDVLVFDFCGFYARLRLALVRVDILWMWTPMRGDTRNGKSDGERKTTI